MTGLGVVVALSKEPFINVTTFKRDGTAVAMPTPPQVSTGTPPPPRSPTARQRARPSARSEACSRTGNGEGATAAKNT